MLLALIQYVSRATLRIASWMAWHNALVQGWLAWFDFRSSRCECAASNAKVETLDAAVWGKSFVVTVASSRQIRVLNMELFCKLAMQVNIPRSNKRLLTILALLPISVLILASTTCSGWTILRKPLARFYKAFSGRLKPSPTRAMVQTTGGITQRWRCSSSSRLSSARF